MARVQPQDIESIGHFDVVSGGDLQPFIDDAHVIVNDRVEPLVDADDGALLKVVEKYLAAHLASLKEQRIDTQSIGDGEVDYEGDTGLGLEYTRYGQQAMKFAPDGAFESRSGSNYSTATHSDSEYDLISTPLHDETE